VSTDLATLQSTVDSAVRLALIDVAYAEATFRRAGLDRLDAARDALAAGATLDQVSDALGGLEVADVFALFPEDPR
jgi:hypothetical protein